MWITQPGISLTSCKLFLDTTLPTGLQLMKLSGTPSLPGIITGDFSQEVQLLHFGDVGMQT